MSNVDEPPTPDAAARSALPPSAKLVLKVLEDGGKLTQGSLSEETYMPRRTTRHALRELRRGGFVDKEVHVVDARKRLYSLSDAYLRHVEPEADD